MPSQNYDFAKPHLLGIAGLNRPEVESLLDLADTYVEQGRLANKTSDKLSGLTQINLFFEPSTRTQSSFEIAGKRLGMDVINMAVKSSSVAKGETLIDTAITLNAMHPDLLVVRHPASGAVELLSQKVDCAIVNAGDGQHEHPTQALLDALAMRRALGSLDGLRIAICGDIAHSRVARSNVALLNLLAAEVRLCGPPTLLPSDADRWGAEVFFDMDEAVKDCDVVMVLRLQSERMDHAAIPSTREYFRFYGLDRNRLAKAGPGALVMHPGPMNRGVEIDSDIADDPKISLITGQVEMGVAVRMAVLDRLACNRVSAE
ncbi:Aspartate carbamoyltransferase [hydrothermal vent metagenome]|uniref:aspartate carbamoyltransferase n=1 Tax=hydrothermal vent metagenome TaxID=652676 RepID=A0A3B0REM3_9ZZZZ